MTSSDDDVIKIASVNRGSADETTRATTDREDCSPPRAGSASSASCPPRAGSDRLQLTHWPRRTTASAPLLPSDVVVCLGTCRNGGYQTTTTATPVPPPSYAESVCRCIQPPSTLTRFQRHYPASTCTELLTSQAPQLNYYTNRT